MIRTNGRPTSNKNWHSEERKADGRREDTQENSKHKNGRKIDQIERAYT